jgi:hypothetical protein
VSNGEQVVSLITLDGPDVLAGGLAEGDLDTVRGNGNEDQRSVDVGSRDLEEREVRYPVPGSGRSIGPCLATTRGKNGREARKGRMRRQLIAYRLPLRISQPTTYLEK